MTLYQNKYHPETSRLKGWDYRNAGYYFVTICTQNHVPCFGDVIDGQALLDRIAQNRAYVAGAESRNTTPGLTWTNL